MFSIRAEPVPAHADLSGLRAGATRHCGETARRVLRISPDPGRARSVPVRNLSWTPVHRGPCPVLAQVSDEGLQAFRGRGVRELYAQGRLPVRLTLGALAVFDAAQRTQDRGQPWGDALDHAARVALRFLDLLPDAAFGGASSDLDLVAFGIEPLEH
jgi:hypothetical protein